jgi:hypothetical protein
LKAARHDERHAGGGFADDTGEASGPRAFFEGGEDIAAGVEIDDTPGNEAGAGQARGIGIGALLNPEHRPVPPRQDAGDKQGRGGGMFGLGAEASDLMKTGS